MESFYICRHSDVFVMIGNAVPVRMANVLAKKILSDLSAVNVVQAPKAKCWEKVSSMIDNAAVSA